MSKSCIHPPDLAEALSNLKALHGGDIAVADIVAFGESAIPALKETLFECDRSGLYQIRCRAARALGLIGAFDVLEEFLEKPPPTDPVERLGDDVIVGNAARALAKRRDEATFALLMEIARRRPLNGVITALASFKRPEASPALVAALGEDEAREAAENALTSCGPAARTALFEALCQVEFTSDPSESQLRKRRSILRLLGAIKLDPAEADRLRPFLASADTQLSILACRVVLRSSKSMRLRARARLMDLRPQVTWSERSRIDEYLSSATGQ